MAHKTAEELKCALQKARERVLVRRQYFHYKHPELFYTIVDLVIIEETDGVGVLYRADYESLKGIGFLRPIESFLDEVEIAGEKMKRFSLVEI
ncbi:MAG: DUF1653 domain-containing protein [Candidatus Moraniibacteriota bacterium]